MLMAVVRMVLAPAFSAAVMERVVQVDQFVVRGKFSDAFTTAPLIVTDSRREALPNE